MIPDRSSGDRGSRSSVVIDDDDGATELAERLDAAADEVAEYVGEVGDAAADDDDVTDDSPVLESVDEADERDEAEEDVDVADTAEEDDGNTG